MSSSDWTYCDRNGTTVLVSEMVGTCDFEYRHRPCDDGQRFERYDDATMEWQLVGEYGNLEDFLTGRRAIRGLDGG